MNPLIHCLVVSLLLLAIFPSHQGSTVRKSGSHDNSTLDHAFSTHLSWLSDLQKEGLKTLKSQGKAPKEIQRAIYEAFNELDSSSKKQQVKRIFMKFCEDRIEKILGKEKFEQLDKSARGMERSNWLTMFLKTLEKSEDDNRELTNVCLVVKDPDMPIYLLLKHFV